MKHTSAIIAAGLNLLLITTVLNGCVAPEERALPSAQSRQNVPVLAQSKTDTVKIVAMKFVPAELTVTSGTTIVFINNDMVTHDITEEATKAWSSGLLAPSKLWGMTADKTANYYCSIHAVMKGKITVRQ